MKKVQFYRDLRSLTGGHLKVWHYYKHVESFPEYHASIKFTEQTIWDLGNPWYEKENLIKDTWGSTDIDIHFLAGVDWKRVATNELAGKPIINLIQGFGHVEQTDVRFSFLQKRAVRICVSEEVEDALLRTKKVNGPLFAIKNGIQVGELPIPKDFGKKSTDLLICAVKQPALGTKIYDKVLNQNIDVEIIKRRIPRPDFLNKMNDSKFVLFLPKEREGFYLPPLEAMCINSIAITPDCIGNRSYCIDNYNCKFIGYKFDDLVRSLHILQDWDAKHVNDVIEGGRETVKRFSIERERNQFYDIISNIDQLF